MSHNARLLHHETIDQCLNEQRLNLSYFNGTLLWITMTMLFALLTAQ